MEVIFINEEAALAIIHYMEEQLFEPQLNWPRYWFSQRTYSRWAATEILESVMDHPYASPVDIIEDFIIRMIYFAELNENSYTSRIFSTAKETAKDMLNLFGRRK